MIDVAVVGAGTWGKNHVRTWAALPGARLVAVCDADAGARSRALRLAPSARAVASLDELLADDAVRAVVLASPAPLHAEQARAALAAGKDVLVEKPMALSPRDAEDLCELAERRGAVLMVGHLMLYHPGVERLIEIVRGGEIGQVRYAYAMRVNLGRLRRDENALWSFAPHDVSVLLALLETPPLDVAARGACYLQDGIQDVVFLNLRFAGGPMAQVQLSWLDPHKERKLTVVGSRKMVIFDDTRPDQMLVVHDKGYDAPPDFQTYGEFLALRDGDVHIRRVPMREPLAAECAHFLECVRTRATPRSSGREGLAVVRVLAAAQTSLEHDGAPVRLDGR